MHYMGMEAMIMGADHVYTPGWFAVSVAVGIAASAAAMILTFTVVHRATRRKQMWRFVAAMVMGTAICGVHYTGMLAVVFVPHSDMALKMGGTDGMTGMVLAVFTVAFVTLAISLFVNTRFKDDELVDDREGHHRLLMFARLALTGLVGGALTIFAASMLGHADKVNMQEHFLLDARDLTKNYVKEVDDLLLASHGAPSTVSVERLMEEQKRDAEAIDMLATGGAFAWKEGSREAEVNTLNEDNLFYRRDFKRGEMGWWIELRPKERGHAGSGQLVFAGIFLLGMTFTCILCAYLYLLDEQEARDRMMGMHIREAKDAQEKARQAARQADSAKSNFLSTISHEIRTPMNGILGMLDLLLQTPLNTEQQEMARTARKSTETLQALLTDILDYSKIEKGTLRLEKGDFNLRNVMEEIVEMFGPWADKKVITLVCNCQADMPRRVVGDVGRLRQVLINLMENAIKFTSGGLAELNALRVGETPNSLSIRFVVKDTGIGISAEAQRTLFERFHQADSSSTRQYEGAGLGLALCKNLVEMMGGSLQVVSEPGKGAEFSFILPMEKAPPSLPHSPLTPGCLNGLKVLLADGHHTRARMERETLEFWGATCTRAHSADEALTLLKDPALSFNMVIFDDALSKDHGTAFAASVRGVHTDKLALVVHTHGGADVDAEAFGKAGYNGVLTRPLRASMLERMAFTLHVVHPKEVLTAAILKPPAEVREIPSVESKRVLVVEDDITNQKVATKLVSQLGCDSAIANNGVEALEMLKKEHFDVVLMDLRMPFMDGMEVTRQFREWEKEHARKRTPVIAFTANVTSEDRENCLRAGMDDFLGKPVMMERFQTCLGRWLSV